MIDDQIEKFVRDFQIHKVTVKFFTEDKGNEDSAEFLFRYILEASNNL
jgi:acid stress-induced BolA-like protein IbaG/YrbA